MESNEGDTYKARELVVEPVVKCQPLQQAEELVMVKLAWSCLHKLVKSVLASLVRIFIDTQHRTYPHSASHQPPRPTQPSTLSGAGNEYQLKCGDVLLLGSKGMMADSTCGWQVKLCDPSLTRANLSTIE